MSRVSPLRKLVRDRIDHYNETINMMSLGRTEESINASLTGTGKALLNANPAWWCDREKPELEGDELMKYAQAIYELNEMLAEESDGQEYFIP